MLRKVVASDLQDERDNCNFDTDEMHDILANWAVHGKEAKEFKRTVDHMTETDPNLQLTH